MYYLVYGFFYLVSLLPMRALYFISDCIYVIIYHIIGYRRKVVMNNLQIAFPEKKEDELVIIAKQFYHNFIDSLIEVIKLFSCSESFLQKRFSVDMKVLDELYKTGKSCQLHLGHTFNWEWGQLFLSSLTAYKLMVVYMPISNKIFEKMFYKLRTRSGNVFIPATDMRNTMLSYTQTQYLLGLVADQNPGKPQNAYWLNFFGRPTPFVSGPEKGAYTNQLPVVFAYMEKPKRGHYRAVLELASNDASQSVPGQLTVKYVRYLENVIRRNPSMWLWSHRRWKHSWKEEYKDLWVDTDPPIV